MPEPRTRRRIQQAAQPALCRCPEGWPKLAAVFVDGEPVREWRHNLGECGLEPTPDGDRPGWPPACTCTPIPGETVREANPQCPLHGRPA